MRQDGRLIVLTNREPFAISEREGKRIVERPAGGLIAALEPAMRSTHGIWVSSDQQNLAANPEVSAQLESLDWSWQPVEVSKERFEQYYLGLSNRALWPLYHCRPGAAVYSRPEWESYRKVNEQFAGTAHALLAEDDIVWIHDYQLSLVPQALRARGLPPNVRIGFLLHVPFPSYELFRTLPWGREILEGMLGASLVVFHVIEYCEHFFDSVEQILDIRCDRLRGRIRYQGRWIHVRAVPIGIDTAQIYAAIGEPETQRRAEEIKANVATEHLIIGVDRLDYTKGIKERLNAFEVFLGRHEQWRNRVSMIQIAVPSRDLIEDYQQLRLEIEQQTGHLNGLFGNPKWAPVTLMVRSIPFDELMAYYLAADVALVTPLRDGMNLVAKEYVAAHRDRPGVLILSEFAGAAQQLTEADLVNPYDVDGMAEALNDALMRLPNLSRRPMRSMNAKVERFDIRYWMDSFLNEMLYVD